VSDGEIFQHILKAKRGSARLNNHEFEVHHGGGERIDQSALARILDERIVCVIVDSDMQSPSDGISEKVRRLSRVLQEADWAFAHVLVLPCRESENILTDDVFSALPVRFGKEHTLESLLAIEEQEALSNTEYSERFWLFFDMKRGIDVATLGDLAPSTKVWILGKLAMAGSPDTVEGFGERISASLLSSGDALGRLRAAVQTRRFDVVFGSVFDHALWVGLAARRQFA
jgi:hypothetical protein